MREEERAIYLLDLFPALGEDDHLVLEDVPCGVLEAQLGEGHHRRVDLVRLIRPVLQQVERRTSTCTVPLEHGDATPPLSGPCLFCLF